MMIIPHLKLSSFSLYYILAKSNKKIIRNVLVPTFIVTIYIYTYLHRYIHTNIYIIYTDIHTYVRTYAGTSLSFLLKEFSTLIKPASVERDARDFLNEIVSLRWMNEGFVGKKRHPRRETRSLVRVSACIQGD